jgi:dTDP-glucose 4,6-dehydratase
MPNILVTGGAGFIGANFVNMLVSNRLPAFDNWNVTVLDALTYAGNTNRILELEDSQRISFVRGSINDAPLVRELVQSCDGVINFAAETHVDRSITDPRVFFETNIFGVITILEAMKSSNKRFLQISTDEVYGSISEGFATESSILNPSSPYSASKASAELITSSYFTTFGNDVVTTRCSNNYGVGQYPEKLIPLFIDLLKKGKNVPVYGSGENLRDWIHVDDHCRAISMAFGKGISGEIYNIGAEEHYSNLEVTRMLLDKFGLTESRISYVEDRQGHDFRYAIDSKKIKNKLGWAPMHNLRDSLDSLIEAQF